MEVIEPSEYGRGYLLGDKSEWTNTSGPNEVDLRDGRLAKAAELD
jgi:hypothetical protein